MSNDWFSCRYCTQGSTGPRSQDSIRSSFWLPLPTPCVLITSPHPLCSDYLSPPPVLWLPLPTNKALVPLLFFILSCYNVEHFCRAGKPGDVCSATTASHCKSSHSTASHCITSHCIASHWITSHCTARHCIASYCIASHCTASHCTASHFRASNCIAGYCTAGRIRASHCTARSDERIVNARLGTNKYLECVLVLFGTYAMMARCWVTYFRG